MNILNDGPQTTAELLSTIGYLQSLPFFLHRIRAKLNHRFQLGHTRLCPEFICLVVRAGDQQRLSFSGVIHGKHQNDSGPQFIVPL